MRGNSTPLLGELLATIHRDGGHYASEHGDAKATVDAIKIVLEERGALAMLRHRHEPEPITPAPHPSTGLVFCSWCGAWGNHIMATCDEYANACSQDSTRWR